MRRGTESLSRTGQDAGIPPSMTSRGRIARRHGRWEFIGIFSGRRREGFASCPSVAQPASCHVGPPDRALYQLIQCISPADRRSATEGSPVRSALAAVIRPSRGEDPLAPSSLTPHGVARAVLNQSARQLRRNELLWD